MLMVSLDLVVDIYLRLDWTRGSLVALVCAVWEDVLEEERVNKREGEESDSNRR